MSLISLHLKKGEDRRIRAGHPWVFSNEIDTQRSPLKALKPGQEVSVVAFDKTFLGMAYVNPHSLITARLYSRVPNINLDIDFFRERIKQAGNLRAHIFSAPYYRLVFSEADNIPGIIIDRFGDDFVLQVNTAGMELQIENITAALLALYPNISSLLLRNDSSMRAHEGLESYVKLAYGSAPDYLHIEENGVTFNAPFLKGQKTGWFYDHRMNRARLKDYVANAKVLDVFSYVGGWGIQAAVFGAAQVDCIEVSEFACKFIKQNALLNTVSNKINIICDDAFDALKNLFQQQQQYDVIILDPPAFIKRFKDRKEGLIAYQRLNEIALKLLVPGGILFSCSCSMHLLPEDLLQILQRVAYRTQSNIQILERGHQGPDHPVHISIPETDYLKAIIVRKI